MSRYSDTGYITYLVKENRVDQSRDGYDHFALKMLDVRTAGKRPVVIGNFATKGRESLWTLGKEGPFPAEKYPLTSKGVVLLRDDNTVISFFSYGQPVHTTALPVGYKAIDFNITSDLDYGRHIIIVQHRGNRKLFGLIPSDREELYDVSFWNMEHGQMTATAKNVVVNVSTQQTFENYVSTSQIINAKTGPLAVTVEDTMHKTVARNLATLEKVVLVETESKQGHGFQSGYEHRPSGGQGEYGKVWVQFGIANGALSNSQISDLEGWMVKNSTKNTTPAQTVVAGD